MGNGSAWVGGVNKWWQWATFEGGLEGNGVSHGNMGKEDPDMHAMQWPV